MVMSSSSEDIFWNCSYPTVIVTGSIARRRSSTTTIHNQAGPCRVTAIAWWRIRCTASPALDIERIDNRRHSAALRRLRSYLAR